jgi:hypothetical protein
MSPIHIPVTSSPLIHYFPWTNGIATILGKRAFLEQNIHESGHTKDLVLVCFVSTLIPSIAYFVIETGGTGGSIA